MRPKLGTARQRRREFALGVAVGKQQMCGHSSCRRSKALNSRPRSGNATPWTLKGPGADDQKSSGESARLRGGSGCGAIPLGTTHRY